MEISVSIFVLEGLTSWAGPSGHAVDVADDSVDTGDGAGVKGGEKVYRWGVEVQGKCPVKCSAKMSLG